MKSSSRLSGSPRHGRVAYGWVYSIALLAGCAGGGGGQGPAELKDGDTVRVTGIAKGDELTVEKDGRSARLRLLGLHAFYPVIEDPKLREFGSNSEQFLRDNLLEQRVTLTFDQPIKDTHGRYLAYVAKEGQDIGRKMVDEGLVLVYTEFPFAREKDYLDVEAQARVARRKVWEPIGFRQIIAGLRSQWAHGRKEVLDPLIKTDPGAAAIR